MKTKNNWIALQVKPAGEYCNSDCVYCYNPKKREDLGVMSDEVLDCLLKRYVEYSPEHLTFSWHGGEPTIAGLSFYEKVVDKIASFGNPDQTVYHMMQTNGTLMTEEFAKFFRRNNFSIGVSIDGPERIHSKQRLLGNGKSSFSKAMAAIEILRRNGVEPAIICTVTKLSYKYAKEILAFFVENKLLGLSFSPAAYVDKRKKGGEDLILDSGEWFEFLRDLFDAWCEYDNSKIQIREINEIISWRLGKPLTLCSSGKACTHWFSVSPFGEVSACEYYNFAGSFGNITRNSFSDIFRSKMYQAFEEDQLFVNPQCKSCEFFNLCGNGCSRLRQKDNEFSTRGVYMYCEQRKKLYHEINSCFNRVYAERG